MKAYRFLLIFILVNLFGCASDSNNLSERELRKVLEYYKSPKDSLKLEAAKFLIRNMKFNYQLEGASLQPYNDFFRYIGTLPRERISSIPWNSEVLGEMLDSMRNIYGDPLSSTHNVFDMQSMSGEFLLNNIDSAFYVWENFPWAKHLNFEQFCEYLLPYRSQNEPLEPWRKKLFERYSWVLDSVQDPTDPVEACKLLNKNTQMEYNVGMLKYGPSLSLSQMDWVMKGLCIDNVNKAILSMRAMGLPVMIDFTPNWGNHDQGHFWGTVLNNRRKNEAFDAAIPRDLVFQNTVSKVYRKTYSFQASSLALTNHGEEEIPTLFKDPRMLDVTNQYNSYFPIHDVSVKISKVKTKYAYLCVFDRGWIPVAWGKIDLVEKVAYFPSVGSNIVYIPMLFENSQLVPAGDPFILTSKGKLKHLTPSKSLMAIDLDRKFPMSKEKVAWAKSMMGGKFQGANKEDFSDARDLFTVSAMPKASYENVEITTSGYFRFLRFLAHDSLEEFSIAELKFFDAKDKLLHGSPIGSKMDFQKSHEKPFDDKALTFYEDAKSSSKWVGLDLLKSSNIGRIQFLPRNDGNSIDVGDTYELFYWDGGWVSAGRKMAEKSFLSFYKVPQSALFWLRDVSKGKEERIFTYEDGKQIWW